MTGTTGPKGPNDGTENPKKTLTLTKKLELKRPIGKDQVKQSFSHGRSKTVEVEVKRKRTSVTHKEDEFFTHQPQQVEPQVIQPSSPPNQQASSDSNKAARLTHGELETRLKALQEALKNENPHDQSSQLNSGSISHLDSQDSPVDTSVDDTIREEEVQQEEKILSPPPPVSSKKIEPQIVQKKITAPETFTPIILRAAGYGPPKPPIQKSEAISSAEEVEKNRNKGIVDDPAKALKSKSFNSDEEEAKKKHGPVRPDGKKIHVVKKSFEPPRKLNRNVLTKALDGESEGRSRSIASLKRARLKSKLHHDEEVVKIVREVIIPETIMVGELANRMAVRGADVVKSLMKLGMMVTINQILDADTAELICTEFGHKPKRVADSDIEIGLGGIEDTLENMLPRAPVVTIMGHVDHGKTSLLDALRQTDVASGEAGGITQHIGAYQVTLKTGKKITFIDTPGHAAFSEMRARGANVTDIVVLVVAADDGVMPQTIEAINHAKAAKVPIIVAINKIDKPESNADRVRSELLQHEVILEDFGGDIMSVEVSAKKALNLDKLEETILLQAEILDLKANPNRFAQGVVVEARIEKGRGSVATVLVQKGTLKVGDIFVAGTEWGRIRVLVSDHGKTLMQATPSMPVEVLGLSGTPGAGEEFFIVENETKAREITEYRQNHRREKALAGNSRTSMEKMMSQIAAGETKELSLVIKTDVQGSLEAISSSLAKLSTSEVSARVLHGGVGGISESDVTLARASSGIIIAFNVRANPQAKELARRDGVEIRYYSIIYDALDDLKAVMSGLLAPTIQEKFLGYAEIRNVFNITKVGKVAGCFITEGLVKRGAKVRLLRDNVVIHEGSLKTLKRFKDEVKEVKESFECGMAFENYNDIREGDFIECFELESISRQL